MCKIQSLRIVEILSSAFVAFSLATVVDAQGVVNTAELSPKQLGFAFVEQRIDKNTGFAVGGKNKTENIRRLTSLNDRSIDELEKVMRPGKDSEKGFLGKSERLLDVLAMDNTYVVDKRGFTHQELARPLLIIGYYAMKHARRDGIRIRHGDLNLRVSVAFSRGFQESPFLDGTKTNADVTIKNPDDGKVLTYSLLVPHMIERYGFYEGRGTPYRVEPSKIIDLFNLKRTN